MRDIKEINELLDGIQKLKISCKGHTTHTQILNKKGEDLARYFSKIVIDLDVLKLSPTLTVTAPAIFNGESYQDFTRVIELQNLSIEIEKQ